MRILIADKLAPEGAAFLRAQPDVEVVEQVGLAGDELARALAGCDGAVVRSAVTISREVLDRCGPRTRLRAIGRAGVGVDNIDLVAATRLGIAVMNSASASTITTAEHAFCLMIARLRNVAEAHLTMAAGGWDRNRFIGRQLHGQTLGVVGLGRIGRALAERALAFGMKVVAFDPMINAASALEGRVALVPSFLDLVGQVDVISFHVPKTESTAGMMDAEAFARAKPGIVVINASRGGVVDEQALLDALESGRCGGAALDVFSTEPPPENSPLRTHPGILLTPHLGASTEEAQEAVAVDACRAVLTYLRGDGLPGAVNAGGLSLDLSDRQRAFADLAGRMIALLGALLEPRLELVVFRFKGEELAGRADTVARLALAELLRRSLDEPVNLINAALIAEQRHIETRTVIATEHGDDRLAVEVVQEGTARRVEGAIYADGLPRVTHLDGYALDMVPAGHMVLLTNNDQPGRIGMVGSILGDAGVNIAEMALGRRMDESGRRVAMMILKLDGAPDERVLRRLRGAEGILGVVPVELPPA